METSRYAEDLSKLIQVKTVTNIGDKEFNDFHNVLKELLPNVWAKCEIVNTSGNALLFKWTGKSDKKPIVLMGHQDVVPAEDGNWKYPPYSGTIAEGRVWGRGAMDCKNTLYVSLKAVDELISEGITPEYDVYIASSDNEEKFGTGAPKMKEYMREHGIKPYIVLDEGGAILPEVFPGMTKPYAMVGILEKGYADLKFTAKSKGGHSSSPAKDNPLARLAAFINDVENGHYFRKKMIPEVAEMLCAMSDGLTGPLKFLLKNVKIFKPLITRVMPAVSHYGNALMSTTCVFTEAQGSDAANVIPLEASVVANLRFIPHQDYEDCLAMLTKLAKKYDLDVEVLEGYKSLPPVSTKSDGYKLVYDNIRECFPDIGIAPYLIIGGTDARNFQDICDCVMRFTPMMYSDDQMAAMHSVNESVDVDQLTYGVDFMKKLILKNKYYA